MDGYNVIHAWAELKRTLMRGGIEEARARLVSILQVIHDVEKIRLTIVFDGQGRRIEIQRPSNDPSFSLLFAPSGSSADRIIEQLAFSRKKNTEIIVATQDSLVRNTVISSGSLVISPENLADWVEACEKRQNQNIKNHQKSSEKLWKQNSPWDVL